MPRSDAPRSVPIPTRVLLICAAFAAVQSILFVAIAPVTTALAPIAPPAYAVVAGVHSLMPILARLVTGVTGAATITALITGLLASAFTGLGVLVLVPMILVGLSFDAALPWRGSRSGTRNERVPWWRLAAAGVVAGIVLFAVSLAVFSSEHLTTMMLIATLAGRLVGEIGIAVLAGVTARQLARAGLSRTR